MRKTGFKILLAAVAVVLALSPAGCDRAARDRAPAPRPSGDRSVAAPAGTGPIQLHDVTAETGIDFVHTDGSSGRRYIVETVSSGLALFDYDGDGLIDIYFPNGAPLPGAPAEPPTRHALYKNLGGWRFRDVTEAAGMHSSGYGLGAAAADYDNDGDCDLYVSQFGPNVLYRNNGDGTFTDVTAEAGVADGDRLGAGVAFLDADADGDLDLFAGNYVRFDYADHIVLSHDGFPEYVGPKAYPPDRQTLFRNDGDGTFTDVSEASGLARHPGKGMGVVAADYDRDGDTDILLLNDVFGNFLFRNDGRGHFEEASLEAGFKFNLDGVPLGSMGVDCGDYDNDGLLDFYQTSYQRENPALYRNLGGGVLDDVTARTGAGQGTVGTVKWGCGLVDFDNDGWRDLFVAMGHIQDLIDQYDPTTSYRARNVLLRNERGRFTDVSNRAGDGLLPSQSSRGAAFGDLDNDGDMDAVILNSRSRPTVLRNMLQERGTANHWLQVRLRGVRSNRDGVGAQVTLHVAGQTLVDEVHSGRGYQGHWGLRLHFGLGPHQRIERLEVAWLGGGTDVLADVSADRLITVEEGSAPLAGR